MIDKQIQAYRELQTVIRKHLNEFILDNNLKSVPDTLKRLEISKRFGIPLGGVGNSYNVPGAYDDWTRVVYMKGGYDSIPRSDDERQPKGEWLYRISFPTGRFLFGPASPETFDEFWEELKSFNPKYCDTVNTSMYFSEQNSKIVYDNFWNILKKYQLKAKEETKRLCKIELENELAKLNQEKV